MVSLSVVLLRAVASSNSVGSPMLSEEMDICQEEKFSQEQRLHLLMRRLERNADLCLGVRVAPEVRNKNAGREVITSASFTSK